MKGPGPKVFEEEVLRILEQYCEEDYPDADTSEFDEEAEEAIMKEHVQMWHDYLQKHASPLLLEWVSYYNDRCGDEGELRDWDGSFLINVRGFPIQEWSIDENHRIVDEQGNQIYYSNGVPILAKKMSCELFEFLKEDGWFSKDATEEEMWY